MTQSCSGPLKYDSGNLTSVCVVGGEGATTFPNAVFMFESNVDYDCELLPSACILCARSSSLTPTALVSPLCSSHESLKGITPTYKP